MSKKAPIKTYYRVNYFADYDGTWHEKNATIEATSKKEAESSFIDYIKLVEPETVYRINFTEAI